MSHWCVRMCMCVGEKTLIWHLNSSTKSHNFRFAFGALVLVDYAFESRITEPCPGLEHP